MWVLCTRRVFPVRVMHNTVRAINIKEMVTINATLFVFCTTCTLCFTRKGVGSILRYPYCHRYTRGGTYIIVVPFLENVALHVHSQH